MKLFFLNKFACYTLPQLKYIYSHILTISFKQSGGVFTPATKEIFKWGFSLRQRCRKAMVKAALKHAASEILGGERF